MGLVSTITNPNAIQCARTDQQWLRVETNVSIIAACIPTLQPLYIAITNKIASTKASHDHATDRYQARSGAMGAFCKRGNARGADAEVGLSTELTTYVSSGRYNKSGSERNLVSDAEMPGITKETVIRVLSAHVPT